MSVWTWVLIGLCAAGVLLALGSIVPVIFAALRLRAKLKSIQDRPVFTAAQLLPVQGAHLAKAAADARPLVERAQAAVESIRYSAEHSGYAESRRALEETGSELNDLFSDLR
jgi:hypothetical protein